MYSFSNNMAIGFFIGICFMATIVVVLTIFYFSGERPPNRRPKSNIGHLTKSRTLEARKQPGIAKDNSSFLPIRFFQNRNFFVPFPRSLLKKRRVINGPQTAGQPDLRLQKNPGGKTGTFKPPIYTLPEKNKSKATGKVETIENKSEPANKGEIKEAKSIATNIPGTEEVKSKSNEVPVVPTAESLNKNTENVQTDNNSKVNEAPPKMNVVPSTPSIQIINEKSAGSRTDDKLKTKEFQIINEKSGETKMDSTLNEKSGNDSKTSQKPANLTGDFSELFTQVDIEENESDRLAKELSDIDTSDIMAESLSLISQFKRNKIQT